MKRLFFADSNHRTRVGAVGTTAQWNLVANGRSVDQPTNYSNVGEVQRRVVENRGVLLLPIDELVGELGTVGTKGFCGRIEIQSVTSLILHLGEQDRLATQRRSTRDPIALRLHANDLGMRMLGDLAKHGFAITIGHPVPRFKPLVALYGALEMPLEFL